MNSIFTSQLKQVSACRGLMISVLINEFREFCRFRFATLFTYFLETQTLTPSLRKKFIPPSRKGVISFILDKPPEAGTGRKGVGVGVGGRVVKAEMESEILGTTFPSV